MQLNIRWLLVGFAKRTLDSNVYIHIQFKNCLVYSLCDNRIASLYCKEVGIYKCRLTRVAELVSLI